MKAFYKYTALIGFFLFFIIKSHSQSIPITSYGVWDRGGGVDDYSDPKADFVMGLEVSATWAEVQPVGPGKFDFSQFKND